ncbi:MAG: hypothetical protein ABIT01_08735 [Thermoanaerobaculia bacterium]
MKRFIPGALILLSVSMLGTLFSSSAEAARPLSRAQFLKHVDRALARRNARELAALADWSEWRGAGNPDPKSLRLVLPPSPIKRQRELNEREVLYRDGNGRSWHLVLQEPEGKPKRWSLPILTRSCPEAIQRRPIDDSAPVPTPPPPTSWTPLECWPLPM